MVSWTWWDGAPDESLNGLTLHGVGRPPALYGTDGKRTIHEAAAFSARALPTLLRGKWDVIDCSATPYLPLISTWLASRLTGTRLTATWHEFWGEHWREYLPERPAVARVAMSLESACRRLGDEIVAVSDFTAAALALPEGRVQVVPNGVTLSEIDGAAAQRSGRRRVRRAPDRREAGRSAAGSGWQAPPASAGHELLDHRLRARGGQAAGAGRASGSG